MELPQVKLICLDYIVLNGIELYILFDKYHNYYIELNQVLDMIDVDYSDFKKVEEVNNKITIYKGLTNFAIITGEILEYVLVDDLLIIWCYYAKNSARALDCLFQLSQIGLYSQIRNLL